MKIRIWLGNEYHHTNVPLGTMDWPAVPAPGDTILVQDTESHAAKFVSKYEMRYLVHDREWSMEDGELVVDMEVRRP